MKTATDERNHERQQLLENLKFRTYKFEDELEIVDRRQRYIALAQCLAQAMMDEHPIQLPDCTAAFIHKTIIPILETFSKTQEEFRFLALSMIESFVSTALAEAARDLNIQDVIYSKKHCGPDATNITLAASK